MPLLLVGLGLLKLVHTDIAALFSRLIEMLYLNADSRIIHAPILKVVTLQPHSVFMPSLVSLGYVRMLLLEGIGLWLKCSRAVYLTAILASLLLPFKLYEVIDRVSLLRVGVLAMNVVIVLCLLIQLKRHRLHLPAPASSHL